MYQFNIYKKYAIKALSCSALKSPLSYLSKLLLYSCRYKRQSSPVLYNTFRTTLYLRITRLLTYLVFCAVLSLPLSCMLSSA